MDEKIEAEIPLEFVGVSPAVKDKGAIMVTALDSLHIKALPQDLIHEIKVDISVLKDVGDMLRVSDLKIPEGLEVLNHPDTTVVLAEAPKMEEIKDGAPDAHLPEGADDSEAESNKEDSKEGDGNRPEETSE
jgi:large subunit ribosomal protein L25